MIITELGLFVFFFMGVVVGILWGFTSAKNYNQNWTKEDKAFQKGKKVGYRQGLEEAEKRLVDKLKGLK